MTRRSTRPRAEELYALLLRFYPEGFRARFAHDMRDTFARDYERVRRDGAPASAAFWIRTVSEALWFGSSERLGGYSRLVPVASRERRAPVSSRFAVDWRDAWRALRATPVVAAAAVLSLALGIGANTALFSIMNSLVLKTLPVREPERLVVIDEGSWTNPIWEEIRARQTQIAESAFAWSPQRFDLSVQGQTDFIDGAYASGGMFDVLGLAAVRGRLLTPADDVRGAARGLAVVSYGFWQRRLGAAEDVVGRTITLDRVPFTVVGVMPRDFTGPDVGRACDVVVPIAHQPLIAGNANSLDARSSWWLEIMLRLRSGQTIDAAAAALNGVQPQIREATLPGWPAPMLAQYLSEPLTLAPAASGRSGLRTRFQQPLVVMMVVVGAVLLIACANIANLLLARANARRRDLCVRLALGASRARIGWQLLCESLLLAGTGALLGLGVARLGSALLVRQLGPTVFLDTSLDPRVLAFTAAIGVLTALVFGVAPALVATALAPSEALKEQGRSIAGDRRAGLRNAMVVAQVALSLALIVAAGLFIRTFQGLTTAPLGLNVDRLLIVDVDVKRSGASGAERTDLFERLRDAAASTPGVASAAISTIELLSGQGWNTGVDLPDAEQGMARNRIPWVNGVTPGWFETYGLRIVAGRDLSPDDRLGQPRVTAVNQAFARRYLGGGNPIGRRFTTASPGGEKTEYEIVGLVTDSVYRSIREGTPATMYVPIRQMENPWPSVHLAVALRSEASGEIERRLSEALTGVDAGIAFSFRPFADRMRSTLSQERLVATLSGFFGGLALLLAGVGLYGVTAYAVSRRRTEIGVRMALGAEPARVVRLVLARAAWLVGAGVVIGAGVSLWAAKFVAPALLYGLEPRDPSTLAGAAFVLLSVGLATAWLPARRASRIDPTQVLREG